MKPTALVVTTVHWPDDTRIRERLIRTLARAFEVHYATKAPGPTDSSDLHHVELRGGRIRRNIEAFRLMLRPGWDVIVVHDPELLLGALLVVLTRRRKVVFDVHEDYPAVVHTRAWIPSWARSPLDLMVRSVMRLAEGRMHVSLAEPGYARGFVREHPVFPNFPRTSEYPPVQETRLDEALYLGDATLERGLDTAITACTLADVSFRIVGRVSPEVEELAAAAATVKLEGTLPNPEALRLVCNAAVGLVPLRDEPNYRHSQPTKLLEYLALGVPVVATDLPGTRELVDGLDAVRIVPPGDAAAMAGAILESLTESARQEASAQAAEIRDAFQWPDERVLSFYTSLLNP